MNGRMDKNGATAQQRNRTQQDAGGEGRTMDDERFDDDMVKLLELAAMQQKFASPDDELTIVLEECERSIPVVGSADGGNEEAELQEANAPSAKEAAHLLPRGTVLDGRYALGGVLGQGGFGITYAAQDLVLNARVAIKEYYPTGYVNRNASQSYDVAIVNEKEREFVQRGKERFLDEARTLAKFQNLPGVVGVQSYFEQNGTAYIVMEYLEGTDLRRYLAQSLPFDADDIFERMTPVMDALEQIHAAGMLHRDISPDNIMLLNDGSLKLTDFGAARIINYEEPRTVSIVLKPGYTPEEQYLPKGKLGPWTDIYALCATLYRCITGAAPEEALQRAYEDEMEWPSELGFKISPEQEAVLRKGMATRPEDRFQTIAQLRRILTGEDSASEAMKGLEQAKAAALPGLARATKPVNPAPAKRRGLRAGIAIVVVLAIVAAAVAAVFGMQWATQPRLTDTKLELVVGSKAHVELVNATEDVEWRTDDRDALELKEDGAAVDVEAKQAGTVMLMAVSDEHLYECMVTIDKPRLNKKKLKMYVGETFDLKLKGTEVDVTWKTSKSSVVELKDVKSAEATLVARKPGKATVKAKVAGVSFKCKVTVVKKPSSTNQDTAAQSGGDGGSGSDSSGTSSSHDSFENKPKFDSKDTSASKTDGDESTGSEEGAGEEGTGDSSADTSSDSGESAEPGGDGSASSDSDTQNTGSGSDSTSEDTGASDDASAQKPESES